MDSIREAALSLQGESECGSKVQGTIWFKLDGLLDKKVIDNLFGDFCAKAKEKGAVIHPADLMIVSLTFMEA